MTQASQNMSDCISDNCPQNKRRSHEDQLFDEFRSMSTNTSCLALGNMYIRRNLFLKVLWCLAFVICLILTINQLFKLTRSYLQYSMTTHMDLHYSSLEFPSITICNTNPLRKSMVKSTAPDDLKTFLEVVANKSYYKSDNDTENDSRLKDWVTFRKLISGCDKKKRTTMGHQLNDLMLQCTFDGKKCDTDNMFTLSLNENYGNCFTFNSWEYFNHTTRKIIPRTGHIYGLIMTLYLQLDEYLPNFIPNAGIRVHVHEQQSFESPEPYGYAIPPGLQSSIGLRLERIKRLPEPYGKCSNGKKFESTYRIKYTLKSCRAACDHSRIQKICKCYDQGHDIFVLKKDLLKPCSTPSEIDCMMKYLDTPDDDIECECYPSCREDRYQLIQAMSLWPTDTYESRLVGDLSDINEKITQLANISKSEARSNLVNLIVYQMDSYYNQITEKPSYELDSYLADIGGTLNLFLGFSILTGFEFVESFVLIFAYICNKLIYSSCSCGSYEKEVLSPTESNKQSYKSME